MSQPPAKFAALAVALLSTAPALAQGPSTLWYRQPANLWVEALPVGNGHLGAMVFGRIAHERIQFNEQTVWNGEPHDYAHHGAYQHLAQIRQLLFEGKQKDAEDLAMREFMSVPLRQKAYQAFGDLLLDFPPLPKLKWPATGGLSISTRRLPPSSTLRGASHTGGKSWRATRPR